MENKISRYMIMFLVFIGLTFTVILSFNALGAFVGEQWLNQSLVPDAQNHTYENRSGTITLNVTFTPIGNTSVDAVTTNISNVTWYFRTAENGGGWYTYNTTISSTSNNQTNFQNTSFDTSLLTDGTYNVTIVIHNSSAVFNVTTLFSWNHTHINGTIYYNKTMYNVTIDNTGPTVNRSEVQYSITGRTFNRSVTNLTFNLSARDTLSGVKNITWYFSNSTGTAFNISEGTQTLNDSGQWLQRYNITNLRGGANAVVAFVTDFAGSISNVTWVFEVNAAPNVTFQTSTSFLASSTGQYQNFSSYHGNQTWNVTINSNISGARGNMTHVIFEFQNATGTAFNITFRNATARTGAQNSFILNYNVSDLAEGNHTLRVFVNTSLADYNYTEYIYFWVDRTAPSITVNCGGPYTVGQSVSCTCSASENGTRIKTAATFQGSGSDTDSTTASSAGTFNSPTCAAVDYANNTGSATGSYVVNSASSSGSGSGGSGGGTSVGTKGQFQKKVWSSINSGETASIPVNNGAIGVTDVSFKVKDTAYGAWVNVKKLDALPSSVASFTKKKYKNVEISTSTTLKKAEVENVEIKFKVEKSWLNNNKIDALGVALHRYVGGKWIELSTAKGADDGTYVHYTAKATGFSYFVIGEKSGVTAPTAEKTAEKAAEKAAETAKDGAAPTADEKAGEAMGETGSPVWVWVVIVLLIIGALVWWFTKKK